MGFLRRKRIHVESADGTVAEDLLQRSLVREVRQDGNPLMPTLENLRSEVAAISTYLRTETDLELHPQDRDELAAQLHFTLRHGHSVMTAEQRGLYGIESGSTEKFTVSRT